MITLITVALFSSLVFSWSPEITSEWDKTTKVYGKDLPSSTFATFWGGFRRGTKWNSNQGKMVELKPERFAKAVPVYIQSKTQKRDLIIFYPGVFGKPDSRITANVIEELEKRDVHVAVVPNLLAPTYLTSKPKVTGDPFLDEKQNQRSLFLEIIRTINSEYIDSIHVIAESLGCLQALTTMTPPAPGLKEISSITLLWPPLYLDRAVQRFDALIAQSLPEQKLCDYWWKWPLVIYEMKGRAPPIELSQIHKNCLGAWVIGSGFVESIKKTADAVAEENSIILKQNPETFMGFIENITPEMAPFVRDHDLRLSVDYLLGSYQEQLTKIKLVSSKDDFLNVPGEWDLLKARHPRLAPNIYLFSWGGHSGPLGMDNFINSIYR